MFSFFFKEAGAQGEVVVTWALGHWEKNGGGDGLQHGIFVHPLLDQVWPYEFHQENSLFCASNELHLRGHSVQAFFRTAARRKEHEVFSGM